MKTLSFIEIASLVKELNDLSGSRVDRIYHPSTNRLLVYLYHPHLKKTALKFELPTHMCITAYKDENPEMPSHFCMFLRKYLTNSRITKIEQEPYERIIKIYFTKGEEKFVMVCELFSKGNILLCNEKMQILIPLRSQVWKDRTLRPKLDYVSPPKQIDLANIVPEQFISRLKDSGADKIVKAIAFLGIGGTFAEETCKMSDVEKETNPLDVSEENYKRIYKNFQELLEQTSERKIEPNLVFDSSETLIDVLPFHLNIYKDFKKEKCDSYNQALDEFFAKARTEDVTSSSENKIAQEISKQQKLIETHQKYLESTDEEAKLLKQKADKVYENFGVLDELRKKIYEMKPSHSWEQISSELKKELFVREVRPERGIVLVEFDGIQIEFDITSEITAFANSHYERAKKLGSKKEGILKAIQDAENELQKIKLKKPVESKPILIKKVKKEKEWFEKFVWFKTSGNRLVIGGRDAGQNEILIKKYLEPDDIVFHADVHGSPFAIVKDGVTSSDEEKKETAIFTLCNSKAWQAKRITEVYWVMPEQVSKHAPAGEYIGKGGFMIYGKKNYVRDLELRYAIGFQLESQKLISGPVENVRKNSRYYAVILPGDNSKDALAKKIKDFFVSVARETDKETMSQLDLEDLKEHCIQNSKIFGVID